MRQWVKNAFIFFPLLFAGQLWDGILFSKTFMTFFGFCLMASGLYVFNDLLDVTADRFHHKKCSRPLARGALKEIHAVVLMAVMLISGLWLLGQMGLEMLVIAFIYMALHILYNLVTKKVVLLDVINIALGFQIRIWAGALAANVLPSVWLQMCVFLLALFLGFTKRRYEIVSLGEKAKDHRRVLEHYTPYLLDQIIMICSTLAVVFYGLYTMSGHIIARTGSFNMLYSVVFVLYGFFRYLYLIHVKKLGDDPAEVIFLDKPLLINIFLWIGYIILVLYSK
jgi:4-hydroxybenzoate polyprenyltransferase